MFLFLMEPRLPPYTQRSLTGSCGRPDLPPSSQIEALPVNTTISLFNASYTSVVPFKFASFLAEGRNAWRTFKNEDDQAERLIFYKQERERKIYCQTCTPFPHHHYLLPHHHPSLTGPVSLASVLSPPHKVVIVASSTRRAVVCGGRNLPLICSYTLPVSPVLPLPPSLLFNIPVLSHHYVPCLAFLLFLVSVSFYIVFCSSPSIPFNVIFRPLSFYYFYLLPFFFLSFSCCTLSTRLKNSFYLLIFLSFVFHTSFFSQAFISHTFF